MEDVLGGKIMTELLALRPRIYGYLTDDSDENKKATGSKICVIKRNLRFKDYTNCLEGT